MYADGMVHGNAAGHKFSLALIAQAQNVHGSVSFKWEDRSLGGLRRRGCDENGEYKFMPLYDLRCPINRNGGAAHRGEDDGRGATADSLSVLLDLLFFTYCTRPDVDIFVSVPDGTLRGRLGTGLMRTAKNIVSKR